ncbi:hypothetical protein [Tolypothrix sp. VBCCA 56010]|uniref:hypothetical protein n=1 Tax=Tolypothrix sp. VBCCA 56010 TaxID=3137731 RepID=UPI003D7C8F33
MGHGALGRQCVGRVSRLKASAVMGHGDKEDKEDKGDEGDDKGDNFFLLAITYYLFPMPTNSQCPMPNAHFEC